MVLLFLKIRAKPQSQQGFPLGNHMTLIISLCVVFLPHTLEMIIHVLTSSTSLGDQKAAQDWALIFAVCKHLPSQVVEIYTVLFYV